MFCKILSKIVKGTEDKELRNSQIRLWRHDSYMHCGILDWILEQKKDISETGEI